MLIKSQQLTVDALLDQKSMWYNLHFAKEKPNAPSELPPVQYINKVYERHNNNLPSSSLHQNNQPSTKQKNNKGRNESIQQTMQEVINLNCENQHEKG